MRSVTRDLSRSRISHYKEYAGAASRRQGFFSFFFDVFLRRRGPCCSGGPCATRSAPGYPESSSVTGRVQVRRGNEGVEHLGVRSSRGDRTCANGATCRPPDGVTPQGQRWCSSSRNSALLAVPRRMGRAARLSGRDKMRLLSYTGPLCHLDKGGKLTSWDRRALC